MEEMGDAQPAAAARANRKADSQALKTAIRRYAGTATSGWEF